MPTFVGGPVIRVARILLGVVVTTAICVPVGAGTAAAAALDLECAGNQVTTYSPGLTLVPTEQDVNSQVAYGPCVSASHPEVTSGARTMLNHQVLSCVELAQTSTGQTTITWNTGEQ